MDTYAILYEDDDLAVIHKPAGVVVNEAETVSTPTIQAWWVKRLGENIAPAKEWQDLVPADFPHEYGAPEEIFHQRGGVVHRLDKETSGVLLLAKNPGSLAHLLRQFRVREVQKKYLCLVHGKFAIPEDTLQLPLGRASHNRTQFSVVADGRIAETQYQVQQFFLEIDTQKVLERVEALGLEPPRNWRKKLATAYQGFSLVACWPKTGRTHQIRVHMAHIHHPIVADETYLGRKREQMDSLWCARLFLHAHELEFIHPRSGQTQKVVAELPEDLHQALQCLKEV
jgi:23S rRNA pseudouridine1911/1915/1917 synthase